MKADLEQRLLERFPRLFGATDDTPLGCWGIECGGGWFRVVEAAAEVLAARSRVSGETVQASQIKEKFGSLRFYYYGGDDFASGAIEAAEMASIRTCEVSGAPGRLTSGGWVSTLSPEQAKLHGRKLRKGGTIERLVDGRLRGVQRLMIAEPDMPALYAALPQRWPHILRCGLDGVPVGWADVLDTLCEHLDYSSLPEAPHIAFLGAVDGRLTTEVVGADEHDMGGVAYCCALSERVDHTSGAHDIPVVREE